MTEINNFIPAEESPWWWDTTVEELEHWVATRKAAGAAIDLATCDVGSWCCCVWDAYGLEEGKGTLHEDYQGLSQRSYFVRGPESNGWVHVDDLPAEKTDHGNPRCDLSSRTRRDGWAPGIWVWS